MHSMVPFQVDDAAHRVHEQLAAMGIPHVFIGGLAVGAHGYERMTRDVDVLVNKEDLDRLPGRALANVKGKTFAIGDVDVDIMATPKRPDLFRAVIAAPDDVDGLPMVSLEGLILLKLASGRISDLGDVERLVGLKDKGELAHVRAWLAANAKSRDILSDFDMCVFAAHSPRKNPARKMLRDKWKKRQARKKTASARKKAPAKTKPARRR